VLLIAFISTSSARGLQHRPRASVFFVGMNDKRNWKIYFDWIEGKDYDVLAGEFQLSPETIKEICINKIPPKVRSMPWQRANQYQKFREWKRDHLRQREKLYRTG
jgi:hypothetical protein